MPEAFLKCVRQGGKVRYQGLTKTTQRKICILNGKVYPGHVEKKKKK